MMSYSVEPWGDEWLVIGPDGVAVDSFSSQGEAEKLRDEFNRENQGDPFDDVDLRIRCPECGGWIDPEPAETVCADCFKAMREKAVKWDKFNKVPEIKDLIDRYYLCLDIDDRKRLEAVKKLISAFPKAIGLYPENFETKYSNFVEEYEICLDELRVAVEEK